MQKILGYHEISAESVSTQQYDEKFKIVKKCYKCRHTVQPFLVLHIAIQRKVRLKYNSLSLDQFRPNSSTAVCKNYYDATRNISKHLSSCSKKLSIRKDSARCG